MKKYFILTFLLFAFGAQQAIAAQTAYVSSKQAKIYQKANFSSAAVATLKQKDMLEVLEDKGLWLRVKSGVVSGWISKYSITTDKPREKKVSIFARIKSFFQSDSSRERVTVVSTVGGVRGLSEDDSEASGKKDFKSVEEMESLEVSDEEVDKFVKETVN